MKKCIAYSPLGWTRQAWVPCARKAAEQSLFCRKHGEAVAGAVLGICVNGSRTANSAAQGSDFKRDAIGIDSEKTNERSTRKSAAGSACRQERHG